MRILIGGIVLALTLSATGQAKADSLFYEPCAFKHADLGAPIVNDPFVLVALKSSFFGMSCQDLKSTLEAANIISVSLLPASVVFKSPEAKAALADSLELYGVALTNPVVMSMTVVGAVGFVTVYLVMKKSMKDCEQLEKEQFKQDIINQLKAKYGAKAGPNVDFQIGGQAA